MARTVPQPSPTLLPAPRLRWTGARLALTVALAVLLGALLLRFGDGPRLLATAAGIWERPALLAVFLTTYAAAFAVRAWVWRLLLPDGPGVVRLFSILHVALLANHVFPTKAGELIRVGLLARRGVPLGVAASSTALARLLDFLALLCVALALGAAAGGGAGTLFALLALPLAAVLAGMCGLLLLASGRLAPLWTRLPGRLARLAGEAQTAVTAIAPPRLLLAFAAAAASWLLEAGALWSVAQAASVPVSLTVAAAATAFAVAFQGFQVTPGGIGVYEASLTGALAIYGVDPAAALTLAVATHALKFAYSFAAGIPCLLAEGLDGFGLGLFGAPPRAAAPAGVGLLADPRIAVATLAALLALLAASFWGWIAVVISMAALAAGVLARQWRLGSPALAQPEVPVPGSVLAVLIPVHNEAAAIAGVVAGVPRSALRARGIETRVVVMDDGSTDGSAAIARAAGADFIVRHPERRGLGAALRSGLTAAREMNAGAAVYLDGDGEYDPADIPAMIEPVLRGDADYVLGARFPRCAPAMRPSRRWGNRVLTALLCLLTGRRIGDGQTGFRAFSARALAQAEIVHDYNYAQVLTLNLLRKGMLLAQVPIRYRVRQHGVSFIRYREYLRRVAPALVRELLRP